MGLGKLSEENRFLRPICLGTALSHSESSHKTVKMIWSLQTGTAAREFSVGGRLSLIEHISLAEDVTTLGTLLNV